MNFLIRVAKRSAGTESKTIHQEKGVALVTTLLLLLLITAMSVGMGLTVNSDMLMNSYYRNYRGAFYAADSGLAIARQDIYNQLAAAVPATLSSTTDEPLAVGKEDDVEDYITNTYGNNIVLTGSGKGQAASSWPERFQITNVSISRTGCAVTGATGACGSSTGTPTGYSYTYSYSLTAKGQSSGSEATSITDSGSLIVNVSLAPENNGVTSFAAWGMFIDENPICDGSYLVPGTITGPVFTNGAWTFGNTGSYIFTDSVGSVSTKVGYQPSSGNCSQSTSTTKNGYALTYQVAPKLGQTAIPLPTNDWSQKRAVLDGIGTNTANVSNSDMNAVLRNISKAKYPTGGTSSGVYLPYSVDGSGNATFTGGGIYVQGDASVTLSPSGTAAQIYTIKQGSTTTKITIDPTANGGVGSTLMESGANSVTISGVPMQKDSVTGNPIQDATMLYVNGNITSLSGPVSSNGATAGVAINDGQLITITASRDVTITGDVKYKTEPVTLTASGGTPADTLIPANDKGQALGIFTATGDINMDNAQNSNNLQIDASLATISDGGSGGLTNTGDSINTLTIVGGRIQNEIKNINATTRNVFFDRRYGKNGFAPPWFPSTTVTNTSTFTPSVGDPAFQRTQWVNTTSYY